MRVLLDTNAYTALFRGDESVADRVRQADHVLRASLSAKLRRDSAESIAIPTNDIWIAAHAIESGAELLSFDRHFEEVDGITWTQL